MKFLAMLIVSTVLSGHALAANFMPVNRINSVPAQRLAAVASVIIRNKDSFGDAGRIEAYSFVRKNTEQNHNTIKQLSYARGGATVDDTQLDLQKATIPQIVEYAFFALENGDQENDRAFQSGKANLANALKAIKADSRLKLYGSGHADEDGSWQILYVLDTTVNQILMVKIGYNGT